MKVKTFLIRHHVYIGFAAAILILASWIVTTTLEKKLQSLDNKIDSVSTEFRVMNLLSELQGNLENLERQFRGFIISSEQNFDTVKTNVKAVPCSFENISQPQQVLCQQGQSLDFKSRFHSSVLFTEASFMWGKQLLTIKDSLEKTKTSLALIEALNPDVKSIERHIKTLDETHIHFSNEREEFRKAIAEITGSISPKTVSIEQWNSYVDLKRSYREPFGLFRTKFMEESQSIKETQKLAFANLETLRVEASSELKLAEGFSFWFYILGGLLALMSKWGEHEKENLETQTN